MQWNKTYGTDELYEKRGHSVVQSNDGGYAIAGFSRKYESNDANYLLIKTDSNGNMQWNRTYGGTNEDIALTVIQTVDKGFVLAGYTNSFGVGDNDFWLVKVDSLGNPQWNKTYGGINDDFPYSLVQTVDRGFVIAGNTLSFGVGNRDFLLIKTDSSGNMQWNQTYGGTNDDHASSVIQTGDRGYALVGRTYSIDPDDSFWLVKTDPEGNMEWNQTYGVTGSESASCIVQTDDGGYAIVGSHWPAGGDTSWDFWLVKTDSEGNMLWNQTYGGLNEEFGRSVIQTSDGGYLIAGDTDSFGTGKWDFWLIKITPKIETSISITTSSESNLFGFTSNITGRLSNSTGEGLKGETVVLSYALGGLDTWTPIASAITDDFGNYQALWIPSGTGSFKLKVEWLGNTTHHDANNSTTLNSIAYDNQYVFTVESNSTISTLAFNSTSNILSFTATGPENTTGYIKVTMAKNLVENITDTRIFLDGNQFEYSVSSIQDSWLLQFTYNHSTHEVIVSLNGIIPEFSSWMILPIVMIITFSVIILRKKMKTNVTI